MESLIVIFLLFFAVLAAGWFYLQRAKARDAGKVTSAESSDTTQANEPPSEQPR